MANRVMRHPLGYNSILDTGIENQLKALNAHEMWKYPYVIMQCLCMCKRLRTRNLGQSDRRTQSGQSGCPGKGYLRGPGDTYKPTKTSRP